MTAARPSHWFHQLGLRDPAPPAATGHPAGSQAVMALAATMTLAIFVAPAFPAERWVEDSFADFADGRLDASGQNFYVSRDGSVRTIHRFDLNQDGHLDLVFNSTHDRYTAIPATLASCTSKTRVIHVPLAVDGSRHAVLSDLNNDGFLDAAFCPNAGGAQAGRRFVTILWGGKDGWPAHRATSGLPVHSARRIAAADLNADGWRDLVVLNGRAWLTGQPAGEILRVYWGSEHGFQLTQRADVGVVRAVDIAAGDFDSSGSEDLAVLTSDGRIVVLWAAHSQHESTVIPQPQVTLPNSDAICLTAADADQDGQTDLVIGTRANVLYIVPGSAGPAWGSPVTIQTTNTSQLAVGDLDDDGAPDLALTYFTQSRAGGGEAAGAGRATASRVHVLWGAADGSRFDFAMTRSTQIPVRHAIATAIGDLNADGQPDLAVAVHQGESTMTTDSVIYFGTGKRQFAQSRDPLPTTGATHVVLAPAENELPARAVFCSSVGGTVGEAVPIQVYWGSEDGFANERVWTIPFASGYESTAADLNGDGYTDLVAINSGHAGEIALANPHLGVNIFWGGPDGFDIDERRTVLRELNLGTSNVADLNRDGYLDLVLGQFEAPQGAQPAELILYYGGPDGYSRAARRSIASPGRSISTVVADFDQNGWLDVAVSSYTKDLVRVFWGLPDGFSSEQQLRIPIHSPIDTETADLNGDGQLDLIVGSYQDRLTGAHDLGTTIFWGGGKERAFRHQNAQWLPGFTPIGHCVADFDGDGYLDLFSPHYHGNGTRASLPCYLYWGAENGFGIERRTSLICDSAHDALAGDFDRDGRLDLAVVCHAVDGRHHTDSKIFYNDGRRFAEPRVVRLPTHGPHWMWQEDMGHIYHRRWEQAYESSVFEYQQPASRGRLEFKAEQPAGTSLSFSVRSAAKKSALGSLPWQPLTAGSFELAEDARCVQYRALLESDNGDRYPVLARVEVILESRRD